MFKIKSKHSNHLTDIDTLVIIGNGFDIWQGLYTDYKNFQQYYLNNRDSILQRLGFSKRWNVVREDGSEASFSDVEIIYGDPFKLDELNSDFWYVFEDSLSNVNAERLNLFFGKDDDNLDELSITIENAQSILREAFCDWISEVKVTSEKNSFQFGSNCLFVNFNYTNTLVQRFGVDREKIFHIHGEASDKDSIIFGHSMHPQFPVEELYNFGGRFRGLYFVEKLLYETDKQTYIQYINLLIFLALRGVKLSNIKHIYVLGHSFGPADFDYFKELAIATGCNVTGSFQDFSDIDSMEALHLLISYVILTYGNDGEHPELDAEKAEKFAQWVHQLQKDSIFESIQKQYRRKFFISTKYPHRFKNLKSVISLNKDVPSVKWHITYHTEGDKERIEKTMRMIGVDNYELFHSIDECLKVLNYSE